MIKSKRLTLMLCIYALLALLILAFAELVGADRLYDETGSYQGRVQDNGRIYDETGTYRGRIENRRLHDRRGEYRGHIQSYTRSDEHDEWDETTGRADEYFRSHKGYSPNTLEDDLYPNDW